MLIQNLAILLGVALHVNAAAFQRPFRFRTNDDGDDCPKVFVLGVRGTTEEAPYGAMAPLVDQLKEKISGVEAEGLDYPATGVTPPKEEGGDPIFNFFQYAYSENTGRNAMAAAISNLVSFCPDTSLVLMGYSQGAHVIGDSLCGRKGQILFPDVDPLYPEAYDNLKAIIQLGDPTNQADIAWHKGTAKSSGIGIFARKDFEPCKQWGDRWRSYCDDKDFFCDYSKDAKIKYHLKYVDDYGDEIVKFIVDKVGAKKKDVEPSCMVQELRK